MKRLLLAFALLVAGVAAGDTPVSTTACSGTSPSQSECTATANIQCSCAAATSSSSGGVLSGFFTSFWKLADTSDSIGSTTLTNSATPVTFSAGKVGNAGNFDRTPRALSAASFSLGSASYTIAAWFKTSDASGNLYIFNYNSNSSPSALLRVDGGAVTFSSVGGSITSAGGLANGAWHLVVAYHDSSTTQNTIVIDNGAAFTSAVGATDPSGTHTIGVGSYYNGTLPANLQFVGMLDAVGVAIGKTPTAAQLAAIWNSGAGVEPPF